MNHFLQKITQEPIIFMFLQMWKFSKGNRKNVVFFMILFIFSNIIHLLHPLIFAFFLNEIQRNGVNEENIFFLLQILSSIPLLSIIFWALHGPARVIERANAFLVKNNYELHLLEKILFQNLSWHSSRDSGDIIDKVNNASGGIFGYSENIYNFEAIIVKILGTMIALVYFSGYITLFLLFFISVSLGIMLLFDIKLIPQYKKLNIFKNKISAKIFDSLSNITSVIILNINTTVLSDIKKSVIAPFSLFIKNAKLNEIKWFSISFLIEIVFLLPIAYYIYSRYSSGLVVEVGSITALFLYLQNISEVFFSLGKHYEGVIKNKTDILNAIEIEKSIEKNRGNKIKMRNNGKWKKITAENFQFSYSNKKNWDIDIEKISFQKGQRIAIIGESGSGKTTFLKLLHGLYENANAQIEIDKEKMSTKKFSEIDLESTLVPQEPELFSRSVLENITFGLEFSQKEIWKMLDLAQATSIVKNLENGLQSIINEKGVNLSGGQKQRIALARALLFAQKKQLILLDESTSSVDPENETEIYKNIFSHFRNTTIIASIHKMNLLKFFDIIFIFEKGKIIDKGSFDELYARNKNFKKEWDEYIEQ